MEKLLFFTFKRNDGNGKTCKILIANDGKIKLLLGLNLKN